VEQSDSATSIAHKLLHEEHMWRNNLTISLDPGLLFLFVMLELGKRQT